MDKPRINLTYDASPNKDDSRERIPSFIPRAFRGRKGGGGSWRDRFAGSDAAGRRSLLLPFALATVTGVLLGVCLLILFKGQQSEPTVSIIPPAAASANGQQVKGATVQASGFSLFAWQLGSFPEKLKAETAQQQFAAQGVQTTIRGAGPYQLFAAVAPDKQAGRPVETELKKRNIAFYAKEFKVEDRTGGMAGLKEADGGKASAALSRATELAGQTVQAALTGTGAPAMAEGLVSLQGEWKAVHDALVQAGQKEHAVQWEGLYKQLTNAVEAAQGGQGLLAAQGPLSAFYISYETLTSQLIR